MLCPHCKNEIVLVNHMTTCNVCGANIETNVNNQLEAEKCINQLITDKDRAIIESLLLNDKRVDAMYVVRKIRGKTDALVEARVIRIIEQTTTNEILQQHAIAVNAKRAAERNKPILTTCSACGHQISVKAESCPSCGNPTGVHVCPSCQSINTKAISGASKAGSIFLWGVFAANKVVSKFECKDCGYKW